MYPNNPQDYTKLIKQYFQIQKAKNLVLPSLNSNAIFVASDDTSAITESKQQLSLFSVIGNLTTAENASDIFSRYHPKIQNALVEDFFQLANAEFLVCTFSSNFGRLVYEYRTATKINNFDLYQGMNNILG